MLFDFMVGVLLGVVFTGLLGLLRARQAEQDDADVSGWLEELDALR